MRRCPSVSRGIEMSERSRNRARPESADPVAGDAAGGLYRIQPLPLRGYIFRHALVALRAGKLVLIRDVQHRIPVDRRIILRSGRRIRRRHGRQIDDLPRLRDDPRRVDEPVAAHPDIVIRLGKVRNHIASLIVGHDDFGERRWQPGGFGNHPDARLRPVRAPHHAAEIILVDADRRVGFLLRAERHRRETHDQGDTNGRYHP